MLEILCAALQRIIGTEVLDMTVCAVVQNDQGVQDVVAGSIGSGSMSERTQLLAAVAREYATRTDQAVQGELE